jgi:hypothetical protein
MVRRNRNMYWVWSSIKNIPKENCCYWRHPQRLLVPLPLSLKITSKDFNVISNTCAQQDAFFKHSRNILYDSLAVCVSSVKNCFISGVVGLHSEHSTGEKRRHFLTKFHTTLQKVNMQECVTVRNWKKVQDQQPCTLFVDWRISLVGRLQNHCLDYCCNSKLKDPVQVRLFRETNGTWPNKGIWIVYGTGEWDTMLSGTRLLSVPLARYMETAPSQSVSSDWYYSQYYPPIYMKILLVVSSYFFFPSELCRHFS